MAISSMLSLAHAGESFFSVIYFIEFKPKNGRCTLLSVTYYKRNINELTSNVELDKSHEILVKYLNNIRTSCLFIIQIKLFEQYIFEYLLKYTQ